MAVLSRDDFFDAVNKVIGNNTDDASIQFLEDATDTYNALSEQANGDENWKQKYEDLDNSWRIKYQKRFFSSSGNSSIINDTQTTDDYNPEDITINDLFGGNINGN